MNAKVNLEAAHALIVDIIRTRAHAHVHARAHAEPVTGHTQVHGPALHYVRIRARARVCSQNTITLAWQKMGSTHKIQSAQQTTHGAKRTRDQGPIRKQMQTQASCPRAA